MTEPPLPVVLVTSVGAPPGLNALRALHETGRFAPVALDADRRSPGLYQYGVPHEVIPLARDAERYFDELVEVAIRRKASVLLPCIDPEVIVLSERREEFEAKSGTALLLPDSATVRTAANKHLATAAAARLGFACPKSLHLEPSAGLPLAVERIKSFALESPPPWFAKPAVGHGMNGVEELQSVEDALVYAAKAKVAFLLQERIPGAIGSMHMAGLVYDGSGRVHRRFLSRSIRTLYPNGGPATGGVTLENEALVENTRKLIDAIGAWRGPVCAEWMLDPRDGAFKFIEINPRLWGYGYLATGAGTNFPAAVADLALGREIGPDPGYRVGTTMLRSSVDLIFRECPFALTP